MGDDGRVKVTDGGGQAVERMRIDTPPGIHMTGELVDVVSDLTDSAGPQPDGAGKIGTSRTPGRNRSASGTSQCLARPSAGAATGSLGRALDRRAFRRQKARADTLSPLARFGAMSGWLRA